MGGRVEAEEEEGLDRNSKDKKVNKEGWRLLEEIRNVEMGILNESVAGDERREYTYVESNGDTVIDYIGGEEVRERVKRLEVRDRIDSDHQPLTWRKRGLGRRAEQKGKERRRYGT